MNIMFFNRVPKVGSQTLMSLLHHLGGLNSFVPAYDYIQRKRETVVMKPNAQLQLIKNITDLKEPSVFTKHVAYINFTHFEYPKPIYINLVRDPVERLISWFYYTRAPWVIIHRIKNLNISLPKNDWLQKDFDTCVLEQDKDCIFEQDSKFLNGDHRRQVLFFCGQDKSTCVPFNSFKSMQQAKEIVEKDYAVVGSWEDTNVTLTVLENYIPLFFKDATNVYYNFSKKLKHRNNNWYKRPVNAKVINILRKNLTNEIEFYQFCKQRLYKQYIALQLNKIN